MAELTPGQSAIANMALGSTNPLPSPDIAKPAQVDPFGGMVTTVHTQATPEQVGKSVSAPVSNAGMGMQSLNERTVPIGEPQKEKLTEAVKKILSPAQPAAQEKKKVYDVPVSYHETNLGEPKKGNIDLGWLAAILGTAGDTATALSGGKAEGMKTIADKWAQDKAIQAAQNEKEAELANQKELTDKELANRIQVANIAAGKSQSNKPVTTQDKIRAQLGF